MTDRMIARKADGFGWMIFNNPERRNAVSLDMWRAAMEIMADFARDDEVRVIIIAGAGDKSFVSGADISKFDDERAQEDAVSRYNDATEGTYQAVLTSQKPTIAMIQGYCIGGGTNLAICADLRFCSERARFAIPAAKLGLGYDFPRVRRVMDLIGPAYAKEIFFTARQFTAEEALGMGLVNRVVPHDALEAYTTDTAGQIAANAPLTMRAIKRSVHEALKDAPDRDLEACERLVRACFDSEDYAEGRRAFAEKRKPRFSGRARETTMAESEASEDILYELTDGIAWITFNRPQARNAMTFAMYDRLTEICGIAEEDRDIRAMVLTGAGEKAFVAGTDISQFRSFETAEDAFAYEARIDRVLGALEGVRVPTIAAIAGACTGGGAAIAACCDLRIATADARFGFPVARTLGNCLSMNNYARLKDLIGPARTKELIFTARLMGAEEARELGLLSELVEDRAALMTRAAELAAHVAGMAPLTLQATKEALRRLQTRLTKGEGEDLVRLCYTSNDFREGMEAFLGKRKPNWSGT